MSIEGRINVDFLFHDKSGSRFKIVSLHDSVEHGTGKAAIVSGVASGVEQGINLSPTDYRGADGDFVSFVTINKVVVKNNSDTAIVNYTDGANSVRVLQGSVAMVDSTLDATVDQPLVYSEIGTASYTLYIYGT